MGREGFPWGRLGMRGCGDDDEEKDEVEDDDEGIDEDDEDDDGGYELLEAEVPCFFSTFFRSVSVIKRYVGPKVMRPSLYPVKPS